MALIGYARVSTDTQDLTAQIEALKAAGCDKIYFEKQSGSDRVELARLLRNLRPGDVMIAAKLDRIARSTRDLLNIAHEIEVAGAGFKVLDNPALDTTALYGEFVFTLLGALATLERKLILARTAEGRQARLGSWGEVRPQAQVDGRPAQGSLGPGCCRRDYGCGVEGPRRPYLDVVPAAALRKAYMTPKVGANYFRPPLLDT
jgi:hypothetical protein